MDMESSNGRVHLIRRPIYADMGNDSIHSATCFGDNVMPFRPPFPIVIAVCSPNWSTDTAFQLPALRLQTNAPESRSSFALAGNSIAISRQCHDMYIA